MAGFAVATVLALPGGLDGMVFTAGIGENAATGAELVAACRWLGLEFDAARNAERRGLISRDDAAVKVVVVPTDEERKTARHTVEMLDVIGKRNGRYAKSLRVGR